MLTTADVAARYGVTQVQVGRWCRSGLLVGAKRIGVSPSRATWLIPEEALEGFVPPSIRRKWKEGV